nr:hypothetical protein [Nitrosomonas nitrosa]
MFTKKKWLGSASAHTYKNVIDWDAVGGVIAAVFFIGIILAAINGG